MSGAGTETREEKRPARSGRRWLRKAAVALSWMLVVALALAAPFLLARERGVRQQLLDLALARLPWGGRARLTIERVERLDPSGVALRGIRLDRRAAAGWVHVARVGRLSADWELADLLRGRITLALAQVDSLNLAVPELAALTRSEGPGARRPALRVGIPARFPRVTIRSLVVSPAVIALAGDRRIAGDLYLTDVSSQDNGLAGGLQQAHAILTQPSLELALGPGRLRMRQNGQVEIDTLRVVTSDLRARIDLRATPLAEQRQADLVIDLERLGPGVLAALGFARLPASPGDSLSGRIHLRYAAARVLAELDLAGVVRGERLSALQVQGSAGRDSVRIDQLRIEGAPGVLAAQGIWDRMRREASAALTWEELAPHSAWLPWLGRLPISGSLAGEARVTANFPAGGAAALAGTAEVRGARLRGTAVERVRAVGDVVFGDMVRADTLTIDLQGGHLAARGTWPLAQQEAAVDFRIDSLSLASLHLADDLDLGGRVAGSFAVQGPSRQPRVSGWLRGDDLRYGDYRAEALIADSLDVLPLDQTGSGRLLITGLALGANRAIAEVDVRLTHAQGRFRAAAHLVHPMLEADLTGEFDPRSWLQLERAQLRSRWIGTWSLTQPLRAHWDADGFVTDSLRLTSGDGELCAALHWGSQLREIDGRLALRHCDLRRANAWLQGTDSLLGHCDVLVKAEGVLPDPRIEVALRGTALRWGLLDIGTAAAQASWASGTLTLDTLAVVGAQHRVTSPGIVLRPQRPLMALFGRAAADSAGTPVGAEAFLAAPWEGAIAIERADLSEYAGILGSSVLPAEGERGSRTQLRAGGELVPYRVITPWDPDTTSAAGGLQGSLAGRITLAGSPRAPSVHLTASIPDLRFIRVALGQLTLEATYAESLIQVEQLQLTRDGHTSWARGSYPFLLSLGPPRARPRDGSVRLQAELDELDLGLLSVLTRYLPDASGRLSGQLTVEGSGVKPQVRGALVLSGGGLRIPGRSERIYDAEARLEVGAEGVRILSLDARCGPRGTLTAVGTLRGPQEFDFSAHVDNVRVFEEGRYEFVATADLSAYTARGEAGQAAVPHLDGVVQVLSGTITQDLAERPEAVSAGPVIPWVIDLDVEAPGSVNVSQVNAKAEVGEGTLHLAYRWPYWNASGSLKVLGGTYRLLNNAFNVRDGSVEFRDTGRGPDLTVDINAETFVAAAAEPEGPAETVTILVHVYGKPEALAVDLSSLPPLSQEEIVELLSVGRLTRTGRFQAASETQWILLNTMVDRIENTLIQQSPIFSRMAIEPGTSGDEPLRLTLHPVVTSAFLVNYSQDLAVDPARELSVNYRLSRFLYLRAGIARDRQSAGGFNEEYSLDLKCRFEYE